VRISVLWVQNSGLSGFRLGLGKKIGAYAGAFSQPKHHGAAFQSVPDRFREQGVRTLASFQRFPILKLDPA
jgi:hypothetical protein